MDINFLMHFTEEAASYTDPFSSVPHVTFLAGVLTFSDAQQEDLIHVIGEVVQSTRPFPMLCDTEEMFGEQKNYPVLTLQSSEAHTFHQELLSKVKALGFKLLQPGFAGMNYRPHLTRTPALQFTSGDSFMVDSVLLSSHNRMIGNNVQVRSSWQLPSAGSSRQA